MWEAASGEPLGGFEHANAAVTALAFAPDGSRLLSSGLDNTARVWSLEHVARTHDADTEVTSLSVAGDGSVAVGTTDNVVRVWHGDTLRMINAHDTPIHAVAYSPDGRWLASGGDDEEVLISDATTLRTVRRLGPHRRAVRTIAFSPDSVSVATAGDDGLVRVWSLAGGPPVRTLRYETAIDQLVYVPSVYLPGGGALVAVGRDGRVAVWSLVKASVTPVVHDELTASATRAIAVSADGRRLVASGTDTRIYAIAPDGTIGRRMGRIDGPTDEVRAVAFTRDGSVVITAGADGGVQLWDADKGRLLERLGTRSNPIRALALTADGATLWVGGVDHRVRPWDVHIGARTAAELALVLTREPWELDDHDDVRERWQDAHAAGDSDE